jgi:hypothetical protein
MWAADQRNVSFRRINFSSQIEVSEMADVECKKYEDYWNISREDE